MIKLSDYVTRYLVDRGVEDIFMVSGGGIMHLVDSVGRQPGLNYICNYHEQACAIAAESYARRRNGMGVCLVTTGPGSTNALSGVAGAWVDSVPVLVLSGQVRRQLIADYSKARQLGPQEINIMDMVRPVTKYAVTVMDPMDIRRELDRAFHVATSGRPGPVWINLPLDVQGAMIDESALGSWEVSTSPSSEALDPSIMDGAVRMILAAHRPLWIFGNGIHLSGAQDIMESVVDKTGIPVICTIGGLDLMDEGHPLNMGRFGPVGQRRANFALQNADLLIAVGASLSIASIGFNTDGFAPAAKRIMVNVDASEIDRGNLRVDLGLAMDAKAFLINVATRLRDEPLELSPKWIQACVRWKELYPTITSDYFEDAEHVNTYVFSSVLSELLGPEDTVVTGNSLDIVSIYHSFKIKKGQRVYTNINFGSMGWDLPGAVGAVVAAKGGRTILVTGDGTLQFNVQELLTIKQYKLNVKIFIINNGGYESIRSTQRNFFGGHFVGSDPTSGIGNPDFQALSKAYGMHYALITDQEGLKDRVRGVLEMDGPALCELKVSFDQPRSPKIISVRREDGSMESKPLQDMFPFLPAEEVRANMSLFAEEDEVNARSQGEAG